MKEREYSVLDKVICIENLSDEDKRLQWWDKYRKEIIKAGEGIKIKVTRSDELHYYMELVDFTVSEEEHPSTKCSLTVNAENANVTVTSGGATVEPGEDKLDIDDVIEVSATPVSGYTVKEITVVGADKLDGQTGYKVTGDVTITVTTETESADLSMN